MGFNRLQAMYGLSASNLSASTQFANQASANASAAFSNLITTSVSSGLFDGGTTGGSAPVTSDNPLVPVSYGTGGGTEIDLSTSTNASAGLY